MGGETVPDFYRPAGGRGRQDFTGRELRKSLNASQSSKHPAERLHFWRPNLRTKKVIPVLPDVIPARESRTRGLHALCRAEHKSIKKSPLHIAKSFGNLRVLKEGVEPSRRCRHTPLKRARLPVPPLQLSGVQICYDFFIAQKKILGQQHFLYIHFDEV